MRQDYAQKWIQSCASALFLNDWQIDVRWVDQLDDAHAKVDFEGHWHAVITLSKKFLTEKAELQKRILAHELLHIHHHALDEVAAGGALYDHELERFIERLEVMLSKILPSKP